MSRLAESNMNTNHLMFKKSVAALLLMVASVPSVLNAQHRPFKSVPPTLEIEVLDPGEDPLGNPAVKLENGLVEIPPVVLVHRYYYSGDRSFQGPLLPGGPSILVFNHPKTGERLYVPAQMMPGAPRVTYTKSGITYQYESNAILLRFGLRGNPVVKYRSGLTVPQKVAKTLRVEKVVEKIDKVKANTSRLPERIKNSSVGVVAVANDAAKVVTLPIAHISQIIPFGKSLFSGDLEAYLTEKGAVFKRDLANKRAQKRLAIDDLTIETLR